MSINVSGYNLGAYARAFELSASCTFEDLATKVAVETRRHSAPGSEAATVHAGALQLLLHSMQEPFDVAPLAPTAKLASYFPQSEASKADNGRWEVSAVRPHVPTPALVARPARRAPYPPR